MTAKDVEPQKNDGWFCYNTRTFKRSAGTCLVHETDARNDDNEGYSPLCYGGSTRPAKYER